MAVSDEQLFSRLDGLTLDEYLRRRGDQGVCAAVGGLRDDEFIGQNVDSLANRLVNDLTMTPLNLSLDSAQLDIVEMNRDAQGLFGEWVAIVRATKTIPFTGDSVLWRLQPTPCNLRAPCGDVLDTTLILGAEGRQEEVERAMEQALQAIAQCLEWQGAQIASFNDSLPSNVLRQIRERRARLGDHVAP